MHGLFFYDTYDYNKHEKGLGLPEIPWNQFVGLDEFLIKPNGILLQNRSPPSYTTSSRIFLAFLEMKGT